MHLQPGLELASWLRPFSPRSRHQQPIAPIRVPPIQPLPMGPQPASQLPTLKEPRTFLFEYGGPAVPRRMPPATAFFSFLPRAHCSGQSRAHRSAPRATYPIMIRNKTHDRRPLWACRSLPCATHPAAALFPPQAHRLCHVPQVCAACSPSSHCMFLFL